MARLGGRRRGLRWALTATVAACLGFATSASAINVADVTADPASTQAGSFSDLSISFALDGGAPKDLVIHLPPGLVGNPLATRTCTEAQLNQDACPPASRVGTISNDVTILGLVPQTANGIIYNVKPRKGEPARFGFVLNAPPADKIVLQSPASLRPGDFGLDTVLRDLPQNARVGGIPLPITITAASLTLDGRVGPQDKGFIRLPTSCGTHEVTVEVTPYSGTPGSASDTFDTTGCKSLPFDPEFTAEVVKRGPLSRPVEVSTNIAQTIREAGLRRAKVSLPIDLGPVVDVLYSNCPLATFQAGNCPANTVVGNAVAASPLQADPLKGPVILVEGVVPGALPRIGLDLKGPLALKLTGEVTADFNDPTTAARNQVIFDGLPDIPLNQFTLTFKGGKGGLNLAGRSPCSKPPFSFGTEFLSHAETQAGGDVDAKGNCGKDPRAKVKLKDPRKGNAKLRLNAKAGFSKLRAVTLKLPKGVSFASKRQVKRAGKVKVNGKRTKAFKVKKRSLRLKVKGTGAKRVSGRFSRGAVRVGKKGPDGPFQVVLRDKLGNKFTQVIQPR